jgi:hypothetical protein
MVASLLLAAVALTQDKPPSEFATIDGTIKALYDVISGPAGAKRDWDRFKSIFAPGGMMRAVVTAADGKVRVVEFTPEQYVERNTPAFERQPFFESELKRTTEQYGNIANVWSTYSSSATKGGDPFQRGINTIQMRYDGERWYVISILWQGETDKTPLPKQYLPGS